MKGKKPVQTASQGEQTFAVASRGSQKYVG